jgi:hypothetical protein
LTKPSTSPVRQNLLAYWKIASHIERESTKMTELEMTKLGSWRFSLHLQRLLGKSDSASQPREMIGFEAANAAASMEPQLTPEEHVAYNDGINYALQQWLVGANESQKIE